MTATPASLAGRLCCLVLPAFALGAATLTGCGGGPVREEKIRSEDVPSQRSIEPGATLEHDTALVRAATAPYRVLDSAVAAGYAREVRTCLAHPEHGAMGFHHVKRALLDDRVELERPEILLYGRTAAGEYKLNGVEYIIPYRVLPRDRDPPAIMGQKLRQSDLLELWYLHVWVWEENPAGLFADWNPAVKC